MANTRNEAAKAALQSPGMRKGLGELWARITFLFVALVVSAWSPCASSRN